MQKTDELRTIVSFIQASQAGSFTQAAEVLGLTPAAVSKNVSTLEKSLGVRLFNRTTRSLSLTNEGKQFAEQAKIAVELLTQASENLRQANIAPCQRPIATS
ncbi:regulatory helix-turn-helix LysR family protein [Volucribacter psittacicida]|uniref:Regulatory helix-turn-helix LysR family protein n=1 Tax=Volucribacter psittacicida TaxID=203482 RepID=A0A4R1FL65_9PAST|nr:LysR family transcriptional regulator [Volucribacter psittacicida]TCJ94024.1 regulatory helix-turn-helix LysR family protein [Volucribacter psittacicida]